RVRALLARAGGEDRGSQLVEQVERGRRGGAVRAEADAQAGGAQLGERRDPAAEERVRARAVDDGDVVPGEQLELLRVEMHAVGGDDSLREEAGSRQLADRG